MCSSNLLNILQCGKASLLSRPVLFSFGLSFCSKKIFKLLPMNKFSFFLKVQLVVFYASKKCDDKRFPAVKHRLQAVYV